MSYMSIRFFLTPVLFFCALAPSLYARQPNVIVIYTDDQGTVDAPGFGARDLDMPHLDALAERGIRLTQCYAPAPVCSPSRAGLLTGRYPYRAGVPGNVSSTPGEAGMPADEVTMAEMFREAGYATAHLGKWHLGFTPETMPNAQGFDYSYGHMGGCIDNYSHFFYWQGPNRHDLYRNGTEVHEDGRYFPERMADEAAQFIISNRERPFFIYYAINAPHYPYQGTAEWLKHYQDAGMETPRDIYAAFLSSMDASIGRLLAHLDAEGLREETIIVYQADNGHSVEERAHRGGGSAGPYRGAKFSLFEGGIRVPAIISWPNHLPEGKVRDQVVHGCDWLPTLAELCGLPLPNRALDGVSITSMLHDGELPSPHEHLVWRLGEGATATWGVRKGPWKLMANTVDPTLPQGEVVDTLYLSNLDEDHRERRNFAADYPAVVAELTLIYENWLHGLDKE